MIVKGKFSALDCCCYCRVSQIWHKKLFELVAQFVKAFTLDPAKAGFQEYSTNLNAIQTILANTQASGAKLSRC